MAEAKSKVVAAPGEQKTLDELASAEGQLEKRFQTLVEMTRPNRGTPPPRLLSFNLRIGTSLPPRQAVMTGFWRAGFSA